MKLLQIEICLVLLLLFVVGNLANSETMDPIKAALNDYKKESITISQAKNITTEERQQFYAKWFMKLLEISETNPSSKYYIGALITTQSLANGLEDYEFSEKITNDIYKHRDDLEWKIKWSGELGEVASANYNKTKDKKNAESAVKYFENSIALTKSAKNGKSSANTVIHMNMAANLHGSVLHNNAKAADLYKDARLYLSQMSEADKDRLGRLQYDIEHLASKEMLESVKINDMERAYQNIHLLQKQENKRWPTSHYILELANTKYPKGGSDFIDIVENWIENEKPDSRTPTLNFYLAREYLKEGNFLEAIGIYQKLLDNNKDFFLEQDKHNIEKGRDGYLAEILYQYALALNEIEAYSHAYNLLGQFEEMFPNDPRMKSVQKLLISIAKQLEIDAEILGLDVNKSNNVISANQKQISSSSNLGEVKVNKIAEKLPQKQGNSTSSSHGPSRYIITGIVLLLILASAFCIIRCKADKCNS